MYLLQRSLSDEQLQEERVPPSDAILFERTLPEEPAEVPH